MLSYVYVLLLEMQDFVDFATTKTLHEIYKTEERHVVFNRKTRHSRQEHKRMRNTAVTNFNFLESPATRIPQGKRNQFQAI